MTSIYALKSRFQGLLRPAVSRLAAAGITANQVTLSALALSLMTGGAMVLWPQTPWPWLALPLIMFVRMALNAIDGMLAREHCMKSRLGAILNELGDVLSDIALYLPFALLHAQSAYLVAILVSLAIVSEMTGVIAVQIGASRRYDGPMGKSDRAFMFGTCGLLIGCGMQPGPWLAWVYGATIILLVLTIINRARNALREAHD